MKRSNISNVMKILILAAGIIIVCILVASGFNIARSGKGYLNNGSNQYAKMMSDYDELDITMYDNLETPGEQVATLIEKFPSEFVEIIVYTKQNLENKKNAVTETDLLSKVYTFESHAIITDKSSANYINPISSFKGKVSRNENGVVYLLEFTQN